MKDILLEQVQQGATIFLTSHVLEVVERLCDRVAIITSPGRLVWEGDITPLASDQPILIDGKEHKTLESLFLQVSGERYQATLDWL
jgi:ABC-2 type transport system ATP-binding protein